MRKDHSVKQLVALAMLAAIAYLLMLFIRIPVVLFLKYEPKDVVITIGGFLFGPLSAAAISLVVSLVEMVTASDTGPIGALMNFLATCTFACTAAWIYRSRRTRTGAILGLLAGSVLTVTVMLLWNWLVTPLYMGVPRAQIEALLVPAFLPFNLLKAGLNTAFTLLLYKPLVQALHRSGLITEPPTPRKSKVGLSLFALGLLVTCILLLLVWQKIL